MICGGRAYKGENLEVIVPFNVEDYENFTITFYTTGDYKITKTADEVEIVDGEVRYTFTKDELDVLPDGVLRYTIDYSADNTDYVQSSNTMIVVKTPAGYSATSMSDVVTSATTEGYESGYTQGYTSGVTEGVLEQKSLLSAITITQNGTYTRDDGYSAVTVNVSSGGTCEPIDAFKMAYFDKAYAWLDTGYRIDISDNSKATKIAVDFAYDLVMEGDEAIIFSTRNLASEGTYVDVVIDSTTNKATCKTKSRVGDEERISTCVYKSMSGIGYGTVILTISSGNNNGVRQIRINDGSCETLATFNDTGSFLGRTIVINGRYDGDTHLYSGMDNSLYINSFKIYEDNVLVHDMRWFDNALYDMINNRSLRQEYKGKGDFEDEFTYTDITGDYPWKQ